MSENIALGRNTTESGSIIPFTSARAVDGSTTPLNRWIAQVPCWMIVDLGAVKAIDTWAFVQMSALDRFWANNNYTMGSVQLSGSNDKYSWMPLDQVNPSGQGSVVRHIEVAKYRYFRISITSGLIGNPQLASIVELGLYPAAPTSSLLSDLELTSGVLSPSFYSSTLNYQAIVDNSVSVIEVRPTAQDPNADISVNGHPVESGDYSYPIYLNPGMNTIEVMVTPQVPGYVSTYTINVLREESSELSGLEVSSGTLTPSFSPTTTSYTDNVGYEVTSITVKPTAEDPNNIIKVNGQQVQSGGTSNPIALNVGSNTVTIELFNSGGTLINTYNITVQRASSPYLTQITVGGYLGKAVDITTTIGVLNYTANIPSNVSNVKIKPIAEDPSATIKVNGVVVASGSMSAGIAVSSGDVIKINVTSATGGQEVEYNITIQK